MTLKQKIDRRSPQQKRSLHKVELILEAAMLLLEGGGSKALTTNAVAERAGVSIGTLYQYFPNKEALLDELSRREFAGIGARIVAALEQTDEAQVERFAHLLVAAVHESYGERRHAHRIVLEHALSHGTGERMRGLLIGVIGRLSTTGAGRRPIDEADAFVIAHAVAGVLRAYVSNFDEAPKPEALEAGIVRLIRGFVAGL